MTSMVENFSFFKRGCQLNICLVKVPQLKVFMSKLNFCWLLCCTCHANRNIIANHLDVLKRSLDSYSTKYNNLMIIGDLYTEVYLECMKRFRETYDLSSLNKVPTFHKNPIKT